MVWETLTGLAVGGDDPSRFSPGAARSTPRQREGTKSTHRTGMRLSALPGRTRPDKAPSVRGRTQASDRGRTKPTLSWNHHTDNFVGFLPLRGSFFLPAAQECAASHRKGGSSSSVCAAAACVGVSLSVEQKRGVPQARVVGGEQGRQHGGMGGAAGGRTAPTASGAPQMTC